MTPRHAFLTAAVAALLGAPATADVLWDQTDYDEFGAGFFDSVSGQPPFGITMHAVSDVVVDEAGWTVDRITTSYSAISPSWGIGITEAHLHVFDKNGPLPDEIVDPTASPIVGVSATLEDGVFVVTASGLDLHLTAGAYWIGLTPFAPSGGFGPEIHLGGPGGDVTGDGTTDTADLIVVLASWGPCRS